MRSLLLALLAATALLTGSGCAHRAPTSSGGGSRQDFLVYVSNKSGTQSVPVTIYVDGVCVEDRATPRSRGPARRPAGRSGFGSQRACIRFVPGWRT